MSDASGLIDVSSRELEAAGQSARSRRRVSRPKAVLAVAVLGCFMAFVDATIVNIAVPNIAKEFPGSGLSSVSWVLNAYNIVFAAFLSGGGQLADLLGRRRVFSLDPAAVHARLGAMRGGALTQRIDRRPLDSGRGCRGSRAELACDRAGGPRHS